MLRPVLVVLGVAGILALLWRRTSPLLVLAAGFGAHFLLELVTALSADEPVTLYTAAYVLLLPYSVFRWGSGREAAIGLAIMVGHFLTALVNANLLDAAIGLPFLLLPPTRRPLQASPRGVSTRYKRTARSAVRRES